MGICQSNNKRNNSNTKLNKNIISKITKNPVEKNLNDFNQKEINRSEIRKTTNENIIKSSNETSIRIKETSFYDELIRDNHQIEINFVFPNEDIYKNLYMDIRTSISYNIPLKRFNDIEDYGCYLEEISKSQNKRFRFILLVILDELAEILQRFNILKNSINIRKLIIYNQAIQKKDIELFTRDIRHKISLIDNFNDNIIIKCIYDIQIFKCFFERKNSDFLSNFSSKDQLKNIVSIGNPYKDYLFYDSIRTLSKKDKFNEKQSRLEFLSFLREKINKIIEGEFLIDTPKTSNLESLYDNGGKVEKIGKDIFKEVSLKKNFIYNEIYNNLFHYDNSHLKFLSKSGKFDINNNTIKEEQEIITEIRGLEKNEKYYLNKNLPSKIDLNSPNNEITETEISNNFNDFQIKITKKINDSNSDSKKFPTNDKTNITFNDEKNIKQMESEQPIFFSQKKLNSLKSFYINQKNDKSFLTSNKNKNEKFKEISNDNNSKKENLINENYITNTNNSLKDISYYEKPSGDFVKIKRLDSSKEKNSFKENLTSLDNKNTDLKMIDSIGSTNTRLYVEKEEKNNIKMEYNNKNKNNLKTEESVITFKDNAIYSIFANKLNKEKKISSKDIDTIISSNILISETENVIKTNISKKDIFHGLKEDKKLKRINYEEENILQSYKKNLDNSDYVSEYSDTPQLDGHQLKKPDYTKENFDGYMSFNKTNNKIFSESPNQYLQYLKDALIIEKKTLLNNNQLNGTHKDIYIQSYFLKNKSNFIEIQKIRNYLFNENKILVLPEKIEPFINFYFLRDSTKKEYIYDFNNENLNLSEINFSNSKNIFEIYLTNNYFCNFINKNICKFSSLKKLRENNQPRKSINVNLLKYECLKYPRKQQTTPKFNYDSNNSYILNTNENNIEKRKLDINKTEGDQVTSMKRNLNEKDYEQKIFRSYFNSESNSNKNQNSSIIYRNKEKKNQDKISMDYIKIFKIRFFLKEILKEFEKEERGHEKESLSSLEEIKININPNEIHLNGLKDNENRKEKPVPKIIENLKNSMTIKKFLSNNIENLNLFPDNLYRGIYANKEVIEILNSCLNKPLITRGMMSLYEDIDFVLYFLNDKVDEFTEFSAPHDYYSEFLCNQSKFQNELMMRSKNNGKNYYYKKILIFYFLTFKMKFNFFIIC